LCKIKIIDDAIGENGKPVEFFGDIDATIDAVIEKYDVKIKRRNQV